MTLTPEHEPSTPIKRIIPPQSVVRLKKRESHWGCTPKMGDEFRIGYYGHQDGLDCVWLVSATGHYEQTWDQATLLDYFQVVSQSEEADLYGINRAPLGSL